MKPRLVIVDGVRTPFCKAGTDLAALDAVELGRLVVSELLRRTGLAPGLVDEVIFGCVGQPAEAANLARVIALRAGLPVQVPAVTVHRNCASGLEALTTAHDRLCAGHGRIFIVGGTENMSRYPLLFPPSAARQFGKLARARSPGSRLGALAGFRPRHFRPRQALLLGLTDPVCGLNMGQTAEVLAREFSISRAEQDAFALGSHQRAVAGRAALAAEMVPVSTSGRDALVRDNGPREAQSLAALAKLAPVFEAASGTVTAGNASPVTDGAVALLAMEEARARELGLAPLGALLDYAVAGCAPARMGLGPVFALARLAERTGLAAAEADLVEINEAFAAQVLAVLRAAESETFAREQLGRDRRLGPIAPERLNVNGGAIALGHPVGATGARLILTSLLELRRRQARRALVSLCVGGGQGVALWLERIP